MSPDMVYIFIGSATNLLNRMTEKIDTNISHGYVNINAYLRSRKREAAF